MRKSDLALGRIYTVKYKRGIECYDCGGYWTAVASAVVDNLPTTGYISGSGFFSKFVHTTIKFGERLKCISPKRGYFETVDRGNKLYVAIASMGGIEGLKVSTRKQKAEATETAIVNTKTRIEQIEKDLVYFKEKLARLTQEHADLVAFETDEDELANIIFNAAKAASPAEIAEILKKRKATQLM